MAEDEDLGETFVKPEGDADQAVLSREAGASRVARAVTKKTPTGMLPSITDDVSYGALEPGTSFLDPKGERRKKPWNVASDVDFERVPEGEQFLDPKGNLRQKPKYEGVDFTAQTLYNMSTNDKERARALERSYPGKVKTLEGVEGGKQFYIDDGGVLRKPKGFTDSPKSLAASLTGAAAPTAGAITGEIAGGVAGAGAAGMGAIPGAIMGGVAGSAAGQGFNDAIMQLAGVYDRSVTEEIEGLGVAGLVGGAGSAIGRGMAAIAPQAKQAVKKGAPSAIGEFLGADKEGLDTAVSLREKGVLVPPSTWAKEAPHVQNVVEVFDPAFRTQKPLLQSATAWYEKSAKQLLEAMGVKVDSSIVKPTAEVSTKEAGETILLKAREESSLADAKLQASMEARKADVLAGAPVKESQQVSLRQAEQEARQAAQKLIDAGFQDIERDVAGAMQVAKAGSNSGDLWWAVGEKLKAVRTGIVKRAEKMYGEADALAEGHLPDSQGLAPLARDFLDQLPEGFESRYPSIVKQLRDLGGVPDPKKPGEWIKEPQQPTFGQLHNVRSTLRHGADWYTLSSDVKNGTYKFFAHRVDEILHDKAAVPALKDAARQLDAADAFYGENMNVFNARSIKTVMDGLKAGEPADPQNLFNAIVKEGQSDLTKRVMEMIGPNLASGVRAADVQSMLDASRSLIPDTYDGMQFVREVLDRHRSNMLAAVHGPEMSEKLFKQAQNIAAFNGKLDVAVRPGDTAMDVIRKARLAAEVAKANAEKDPLKTLALSMKKIEQEHKIKLREDRKNDQLGFLYNPTVGANEAVERILGSEDLILAAGAKFGNKSPEFNMLRQVWARRLLEGTMEPGRKLAGVSPEVQSIMFPGVSLEQMQLLAKEMDFLMSSKAGHDTAKSMAAVSKVEHPWSSIPLGKAAGKLVPGFDAAGRAMLGNYYKLVTGLSNNLTLMRWLQKGLQGDPQAREMARSELQRYMQVGGALGAGAAEAEYQTP